ncbi:MAG: hypothetical protein WCE94_09365 [Candidatus Methanoperedens sp.]
MKIRIFLFLLIILITGANAQQATINEEQVLLNGYVDNSGNVLLTGYATPGSLPYMTFLNDTQYTFDNNTNQLYAVTDALTSKSADTWSLNFSLEGYYSDYSVTFDFPAGSQVTKIDVPPELNYQVQVKADSLTLSIHGYRVISPWIKADYILPDVPAQSGNPSNNPLTYVLVVSLIIVLIAAFVFYRHRMQKRIVIPEKKESNDQETEVIPETKPETKEIRITGEMQKVIDTLSDNEKAIISILLKNGGSATQADIRYETRIPKSSLTGIINAMKRKNIIKKREYGRTNVIELSEWFLSEKEPK